MIQNNLSEGSEQIKMFKEIFELIRKGEVILFCGAGMSIDAGYPSGYSLAKAIFNSLSASEQAMLNANQALPELVEDFLEVKSKDRTSLFSILAKEFNIDPKTLSIHLGLEQTPQIKTVITTNYDNLFELAYQEKAVVVKTSSEIGNITSDKILILKIHGDIKNPESLLISKSDYIRFFDSQHEELLWTLVKERMATKHVLFMGYNLDDINMQSVFWKIQENLGSGHRKAFMLAPGLPPLKVKSLARYGISYLDSKAAPFIEMLMQNVRDNIIEDFENNWVDAEVCRKILQNNNLRPTMTASCDRYALTKIDAVGEFKGKMSFSIGAENPAMIAAVRRLFKRDTLSPVTLDHSTVKNLNFSMNGIRFLAKENHRLVFKAIPNFKGEIDIVFGSGKEFEHVGVKIYKIGDYLVLSFQLKTAELQLKFPIAAISKRIKFTYQIDFKHAMEYQRAGDEIETYNFIHSLGSSESMTLYLPKSQTYHFEWEVQQFIVDQAAKSLYYFEGLKKLEKFFSVRFGNVKEITSEGLITLANMLAVTEGNEYMIKWDTELAFHPDLALDTKTIVSSLEGQISKDLICYVGTEETLIFHEQKLILGYAQARLVDPCIKNIEQWLADPSIKIVIMSRCGEAGIRYTKEPPAGLISTVIDPLP